MRLVPSTSSTYCFRGTYPPIAESYDNSDLTSRGYTRPIPSTPVRIVSRSFSSMNRRDREFFTISLPNVRRTISFWEFMSLVIQSNTLRDLLFWIFAANDVISMFRATSSIRSSSSRIIHFDTFLSSPVVIQKRAYERRTSASSWTDVFVDVAFGS